MTNLSQCGSFSIGKVKPALDLGFENAIFSDEIFIAQKQFLVDRSGDIGQQAGLVHSGPSFLFSGIEVGF
jgi:hypothetical protein